MAVQRYEGHYPQPVVVESRCQSTDEHKIGVTCGISEKGKIVPVQMDLGIIILPKYHGSINIYRAVMGIGLTADGVEADKIDLNGIRTYGVTRFSLGDSFGLEGIRIYNLKPIEGNPNLPNLYLNGARTPKLITVKNCHLDQLVLSNLKHLPQGARIDLSGTKVENLVLDNSNLAHVQVDTHNFRTERYSTYNAQIDPDLEYRLNNKAPRTETNIKAMEEPMDTTVALEPCD